MGTIQIIDGEINCSVEDFKDMLDDIENVKNYLEDTTLLVDVDIDDDRLHTIQLAVSSIVHGLRFTLDCTLTHVHIDNRCSGLYKTIDDEVYLSNFLQENMESIKSSLKGKIRDIKYSLTTCFPYDVELGDIGF